MFVSLTARKALLLDLIETAPSPLFVPVGCIRVITTVMPPLVWNPKPKTSKRALPTLRKALGYDYDILAKQKEVAKVNALRIEVSDEEVEG